MVYNPRSKIGVLDSGHFSIQGSTPQRQPGRRKRQRMGWKHLILLLFLLPEVARVSSRGAGEVLATRELFSLWADKRADVLVAPVNQEVAVTGLEGQAECAECSEPSTREYLNGLLARSNTATEDQLCNIAFVKTHKTASTTFAYILYRYARRHDLKLAYFDGHNSAIPLREAVSQTNKGKGRVDIMHYHHSVFGQYEGTWEHAAEAYRKIMRDPDNVKFVTVLREPRRHLLSYYYYFLQPNTKESIHDFLMRPKHPGSDLHHRLKNPMSAEFGIRTADDMDDFLQHHLPHFSLVLLTEQFDEGLMVLRRQLGWDMIDVTYHAMLKTSLGEKRYDGKTLLNVPHYENISTNVQNRINSLTNLDQRLYAAAEAHYAKRRELVIDHLEGDLKQFEELQDIVATYLDGNVSSQANEMYKTANVYSYQTLSHDF